MIVGIMQPYFFPYISYFQLINAVDTFVIYDDVNYINRGWINKNKVLLKGKEHMLTLSVSKASQNKLINEIITYNENRTQERLMKVITHAYSKAPQYTAIFPLLEDIILNCEERFVKYIEHSLIRILDYLDIKKELLISSTINKDEKLKGQAKILEICKKLGATKYVNPVGGMGLYDKKYFEQNNVSLCFLKTKDIKYKQFNNKFIPNLSIIDVLMFNPKDVVGKMLGKYELV